MEYYKTEYCEKNDLRTKLENDGIAVIRNVVTLDKIESCKTKMCITLKNMSSDWEIPLDLKKKSSYHGIFNLAPLHSMLIQNYGLGQAEFAWDIRTDENVANIFSKIWNDCNINDLIVSMDGISIHLPPEITKQGWNTKDKFHTDQCFLEQDMKTIQGLVNLYNINIGDATTKILKGSHKYHAEYYQQYGNELLNNPINHFNLLKEDHMSYFINKGCEKELILANAGDLVLFDSRLMHCGSEPIQERKKSNIRATIYVCMTERNRASLEIQRLRKLLFTNCSVTNHCPYRIEIFDKYPRSYGKKLPIVSDIPKANISEFGLKLI
jgi:hypothetical protein